MIHIDVSGESRNLVGSEFALDDYIAVGFGRAVILKDGEEIFNEDDSEYFKQLSEFEALAQNQPLADWRLIIEAPLWDAEWQRSSEGKWLCVKAGMGFA